MFIVKFLYSLLLFSGGNSLVLGGVDHSGPHLHTIWPQGSTSTLPYVTMGSGSLAAMAVFEAQFKPNMTVKYFV